jgi:hypothetical protein
MTIPSCPTYYRTQLSPEDRQTLYGYLCNRMEAAQDRLKQIKRLPADDFIALEPREAELLGYTRLVDLRMPQEGLPACAGSTRRVGALGEPL